MNTLADSLASLTAATKAMNALTRKQLDELTLQQLDERVASAEWGTWRLS